MQNLDISQLLPGAGLAQIVDWIAGLVFAFLRIGAFLVASPAFGGRWVPLTVRIVASVVLALPVVGRPGMPTGLQLADLNSLPMVGGELMVGLVAGTVLSILFAGASIAGDRIASTAGLSIAAQYDPMAGSTTPVVSQFFGFFLLMVFLEGDGHLLAIRIIMDSYTAAPPGHVPNPALLVQAGLAAGGKMFALGLSLMLPVVAVLTLVNITIGIITRSAPQLNLFSFGFPITMAVTGLLLYVTAPITSLAMTTLWQDAIDGLSHLLAVSGGGNG